jgi:hypothetical protein
MPSSTAYNLLVQPVDDKIVLIGYVNNKFITARLNDDGTLDSTFGGGTAAGASSSTLTTADTAVALSPRGGSSSISALDAASVQQLLTEPDANNSWTRKSRIKLIAL